jgi:hypothetical protein
MIAANLIDRARSPFAMGICGSKEPGSSRELDVSPATRLLASTKLSELVRPNQKIVTIPDSASVDAALRVRARGAACCRRRPPARQPPPLAARFARPPLTLSPLPPAQALASHRILSAPVVPSSGAALAAAASPAPPAAPLPEGSVHPRALGPAARGMAAFIDIHDVLTSFLQGECGPAVCPICFVFYVYSRADAPAT